MDEFITHYRTNANWRTLGATLFTLPIPSVMVWAFSYFVRSDVALLWKAEGFTWFLFVIIWIGCLLGTVIAIGWVALLILALLIMAYSFGVSNGYSSKSIKDSREGVGAMECHKEAEEERHNVSIAWSVIAVSIVRYTLEALGMLAIYIWIISYLGWPAWLRPIACMGAVVSVGALFIIERAIRWHEFRRRYGQWDQDRGGDVGADEES